MKHHQPRAGIGMTSLRTRKRLVDRLREQGISRNEILEAVLNTPRHLFIDEAIAHKAYEDTALPIGFSQTISQPFIVALMSELLLNQVPTCKRVLEIGTGCGYQTAVLAQMAGWVFTIERIKGLQDEAKTRLLDLGYRNISYLNSDGFLGWQSNAPYDGIIVTAAPSEVPEALLAQLNTGGCLVIPVGDAHQQLRTVRRTAQGFEEQCRTPVRFVPMLKGLQR